MNDADATKAALVRALEIQRHHVVGAVEGLDAEAMRRPVLPSGWSCVGLINHLLHDVERWWFRTILTGGLPVDQAESDPWRVPVDVDPGDVVAAYQQECEAANAAIATTALDAAPAVWPEGMFGDWRLDDLQHMLLHVITETATHAGHLDAARELIDGEQWIVLT